MGKSLLWVLPAPLSKQWSFSNQIKLVCNALRLKGLDVTLLKELNLSNIKNIQGSFIMIHGYPSMFPFLFEDIKIPQIVFLWAQVSGEKLARRYNEIKINNLYIVPITPLSKYFFEKAGFPRVTDVIPHMVDIDSFFPLSRTDREKIKDSMGLRNKFVLGNVSVNSSRKRVKELMYIFAGLNDRHKMKLVLKTKRVSTEGDDLGRIAEYLGIERDVIFIEGYLAEADLNRIYNCLDLYCNVSEWEGFGLTIAEAMAARIPVLSHLTQGPGEYIPYREFLVGSETSEEVVGSEVRSVDKEEFIKKIHFAYNNPDILQNFAEEGYQYVLKNFSPEVVTDKFLQLTNKFNQGKYSVKGHFGTVLTEDLQSGIILQRYFR